MRHFASARYISRIATLAIEDLNMTIMIIYAGMDDLKPVLVLLLIIN